MTVAHLASEVAPFSKTGGLADVTGALPQALVRAGLQVAVISPLYPSVVEAGFNPAISDTFTVTVGDRTRTVRLLELVDRGVRYIFVDEPGFFGRAGIYGDAHGDYPDNAERFILFCRAALEAVARLVPEPDVVHCHDWQTALVPLLVKECFPALNWMPTVLTIHNLGYQGNFPKEKFQLLGVPARLFGPDGVEFYGSVSFLKAGLLFADRLTTVSPTYAREIMTAELGFGLDGVLRARAADLSGILNGIDVEVWNPSKDPYLDLCFDSQSLTAKDRNREQLSRELSLRSDRSPLFGCVTRLAGQKGIDKLIAVIPELVAAGARVAILGSGSAEFESKLAKTASDHPGAVAVKLEFSEPLAHRIYAGSDFFLMPSEYEPCGLGQMIALRYGTIPIASRTGGLADSIIDFDEYPDSGTGFLFTRGVLAEFSAKLQHALDLYRDKETLASVRQRAMATDFSWDARCQDYVRLYSELVVKPLPNRNRPG
ncbi:MAG: glycogen synthase GlgA [candidate division WOR-3 bacterium]